jgi:hypothetical protein
MAVDSLDIRMARLEGAYAQINERLGSLETRLVAEIGGLRSELLSAIGGVRSELGSEIGGLRSEMRSEIGGLRSEIGALSAEFRADHADLRRHMTTQFYWVLTFILGSILLPLLRGVAR